MTRPSVIQLAEPDAPVRHPPRRPRSPRPRGRSTGLRPRDQFLLLGLPLLVFLTFFVAPNVLNFVLSLTNWNSYTDNLRFVGLDNFVQLASTGALWNSLRVTLEFAVLVAVFQNGAGLILALVLERTTRSNAVLRAVFFVPVLISPLATGYLFRGMLAYHGPVNAFLSIVTFRPVHIEFLASSRWTIVVVAAVHAWKFFGMTMLVYIAGLAAVPTDIIEAAHVDGAGRWRSFWSIRWPLLAPAVTVNITLTLIGSLNAFDVILATTGGGPGMTTEVFNIFVFQQFGSGAFGVSTSMALVLFLTVVVIAIPLITFLRRRELEA